VSAPGVWRAPQQPADARERLLREIVARVPIERIAEIHLFPPMRQGGVEMGVAVIAAEPEPEVAEGAENAEVAGTTATSGQETQEATDASAADTDVDASGDVDVTPPAAADADLPEHVATLDEVLQAVPVASAGDEPAGAPDVGAAAAACDPTDAAAGPPPEGNDGADDPDVRDPNVAAGADRPPEPAATRYTVLTARYRLTLKGPDRGRWEADVTVEADAPLLTVDAVVRGVQRRAGDGVAPERLDAAALAAALGPVRFSTPAAGAPTP
jgi:hypothetical protein